MKTLVTMLSRLAFLWVLLLAPALAQAQLQINFSPLSLTGSPGDILTVTGTLRNLGPNTIFLNADTFTLQGTGLTLDDTPFLLNAPLSLANNVSYTGSLFDVQVDADADLQQTSGVFLIVGGADANTQDTLGTLTFQVSVVPEPGCMALLASLGVAGTRLYRRWNRHNSGQIHL